MNRHSYKKRGTVLRRVYRPIAICPCGSIPCICVPVPYSSTRMRCKPQCLPQCPNPCPPPCHPPCPNPFPIPPPEVRSSRRDESNQRCFDEQCSYKTPDHGNSHNHHDHHHDDSHDDSHSEVSEDSDSETSHECDHECKHEDCCCTPTIVQCPSSTSYMKFTTIQDLIGPNVGGGQVSYNLASLIPLNAKVIFFTLQAAGGGGRGGITTVSGGQGGSSGAYVDNYFVDLMLHPIANISFTLGAPGMGGAADPVLNNATNALDSYVVGVTNTISSLYLPGGSRGDVGTGAGGNYPMLPFVYNPALNLIGAAGSGAVAGGAGGVGVTGSNGGTILGSSFSGGIGGTSSGGGGGGGSIFGNGGAGGSGNPGSNGGNGGFGAGGGGGATTLVQIGTTGGNGGQAMLRITYGV